MTNFHIFLFDEKNKVPHIRIDTVKADSLDTALEDFVTDKTHRFPPDFLQWPMTQGSNKYATLGRSDYFYFFVNPAEIDNIDEPIRSIVLSLLNDNVVSIC